MSLRDRFLSNADVMSMRPPVADGFVWEDRPDYYADLQERRLAALKADAERLTEGGAMQPDSMSGSIKVTPTEERQSIIKEFEWSITDLQNVVEELYGRLSPVVRSEPEAMATSDAVIPSSDARARLHDLQGTTAALRSLISRLEV